MDLIKEHISSKVILVGALIVVGALFIASISAFIDPWGVFILMGLVTVVLVLFLSISVPHHLLLLLVIYMPLESFITKFVPGPEQVYLAAQMGSELLVYLLFVVVLGKRILSGKSFRRTPIDILLAVFLVGAFFSIVLNDSALIASSLNLRPLLRYVFLFYVVVNLDLTDRQIKAFLWAILVGGAFQLLIGAIQRIGGAPAMSIFAPRPNTLDVFGKTRSFTLVSRGREIGSVFGTVGDTLHFGIFLSVVLIVYLSKIKHLTWKSFLVIAMILAGIALSYARGVFFSTLVILVLWYIFISKPEYIPLLLIIGLSLILVLSGLLLLGGSSFQEEYLNPRQTETGALSNLVSIFSPGYVERAKNQRLGAVLFIPPVVLREKPVFGYGPDLSVAIEQLSETELPDIYRTLKESIFEDVYWVALLSYYGLIGLFAFIGIFGVTVVAAWNKMQNSTNGISQWVATIAFFLVINSIFILFFYRALEFRIFGFYLWFLCGMLFARNHIEANLDRVHAKKN